LVTLRGIEPRLPG